MKRYVCIGVFFLVMISGYTVFANRMQEARQEFLTEKFVEYTIPSEFLIPLSLEFKGLASDLLLVKFMTFIGARTDQLYDFSKEDWDAVRNTLDTITDLDPYYWDAYLYAQVFLTWDETHFEDANKILEKAIRYLPDNYHIPYYIGLNYYNFGKDTEKGAQYLMEASKINGSPSYIATLAARMSAYSSDYERGILFLNEMLKQADNAGVAEQYKMRIELLQAMQYIDSAVRSFQEIYKRSPARLSELVEMGIVSAIPKDPYGGKFYISDNGQISTTSKMVKKRANGKK